MVPEPRGYIPELSYNSIISVIESWELLKRTTKNFEQVYGCKLFQRVLFMSPPTKVLFGYSIDIDVESPELIQSRKFVSHAVVVMEMFDAAFNMLGPDVELVTDIMHELGSKHINYGVTRQMFPIMEEALFHVLEESLRDKFTSSVRQSWKDTFRFLSCSMLQAYETKNCHALMPH